MTKPADWLGRYDGKCVSPADIFAGGRHKIEGQVVMLQNGRAPVGRAWMCIYRYSQTLGNTCMWTLGWPSIKNIAECLTSKQETASSGVGYLLSNLESILH